MDIVINSSDWQRLCELHNKPSVEPGYEYSMQDVLDGIEIFRRSVPIHRIGDGTLAGQDAISTRNREFYDLSNDLLVKLERGVMSSTAEFYTRLDPTVLTTRRAMDALQSQLQKEEAFVKAHWPKRQDERPKPTTFRYHHYVDLSGIRAFKTALSEYYALSRLCGMQDGARYDTQND